MGITRRIKEIFRFAHHPFHFWLVLAPSLAGEMAASFGLKQNNFKVKFF